MQDEVNEKVVSLAIKTSKLTAEVLQKAMKALLAKGKGQLTKVLWELPGHAATRFDLWTAP